MKYSFVVPIYNSSRYIFDAVSSIASEVGSETHEIILVDDASSDVDLVDEMFSSNNSVVVVRKKFKSNAAESRNIGIARSTGEYIFLLDSDDLLVDGALRRRISIHENFACGIVFGRYFEVRAGVLNIVKIPEYTGGDIREYLMLGNGDFRTSSISICRRYYRGTTFDSKSSKHQDWIFGIKSYDNDERIVFDSVPVSIIDCDRDGRMSGKLSVDGSKYFAVNYLNDVSSRNGFSKKNWRNCIMKKDFEAAKFFSDLYVADGFCDQLKVLMFKLVSSRYLISFSFNLVKALRTAKVFVIKTVR